MDKVLGAKLDKLTVKDLNRALKNVTEVVYGMADKNGKEADKLFAVRGVLLGVLGSDAKDNVRVK